MPDYLKACLASFLLVIACTPLLIRLLRRLKYGQNVREDGPKSHLAKSGTPTMGGCIFLLSLPAALIFTGEASRESLYAVYLTLGMGLLGFLDDYLKVKRRNSDGLSSRQKMAGQILIALLFSVAIWRANGGRIWLPIADRYWDLGLFYIPAAVFMITATVNGANFTDGVDGLCSGVTFIIAVAYILLCRVWGLSGIVWIAGSLAGSCLGFLIYNLHPAKIFMGDTGSLALGGTVAALALLTDTALLLPVLGIIYVAEVTSVILQVGYFKMTRGKRLFRMSPVHHHFELGGWSETVVDFVFWSVTVAAAMLYLWILIV